MEHQDQFNIQKFSEMKTLKDGRELPVWFYQDIENYPECQHPSIEDYS
ncbi:hypothetical protein SAMN04487911_15010 [Arenibacter nanhaiticus]|uniref:Uncharacterized protein n=1 Tax=Arenibacter nanhaiticus TaxID=558155 RepID=A0A1M6MY57_9FLAO|nr:hypothetical protein SAMN04487911_15010 [Arenibacter nanhaiticus]